MLILLDPSGDRRKLVARPRGRHSHVDRIENNVVAVADWNRVSIGEQFGDEFAVRLSKKRGQRPIAERKRNAQLFGHSSLLVRLEIARSRRLPHQYGGGCFRGGGL